MQFVDDCTKQAFEMAMSALEAEPLTNYDAISRIEAVGKLAALVDTRATTDTEKAILGRALYVINTMPPLHSTADTTHKKERLLRAVVQEV